MIPTDRRTTVLYDGTCGFCTRGVELAVDRLPRGRDTDWQPYQAVDPATYGLSTAEAERTLHLVEASGRIWHGAGAVGRLLVLSGGVSTGCWPARATIQAAPHGSRSHPRCGPPLP